MAKKYRIELPFDKMGYVWVAFEQLEEEQRGSSILTQKVERQLLTQSFFDDEEKNYHIDIDEKSMPKVREVFSRMLFEHQVKEIDEQLVAQGYVL